MRVPYSNRVVCLSICLSVRLSVQCLVRNLRAIACSLITSKAIAMKLHVSIRHHHIKYLTKSHYSDLYFDQVMPPFDIETLGLELSCNYSNVKLFQYLKLYTSVQHHYVKYLTKFYYSDP